VEAFPQEVLHCPTISSSDPMEGVQSHIYDRDHCAICGAKIEIMIYRGTNVCSDNCRKIYAKCIEEARGGKNSTG
jgi:predicted nucleic acid-binding Zn ribbon protein